MILDLAVLLAVGLLTLALVAGALRWLGRAGGSVEALAAWGVRRGHVRGDGVAAPLEVAGAREHRRFTVGYHAPPGADAVLLLGVDCEATDPRVDDGVLVVKITRPDPELLGGERLDELLDELYELARGLEAASPAEPAPE